MERFWFDRREGKEGVVDAEGGGGVFCSEKWWGEEEGGGGSGGHGGGRTGKNRVPSLD